MTALKLGPLFRRQFLLNPSAEQAVPESFVHSHTFAGQLYHSPDLAVQHVVGPDGHRWTVVGEPVDVVGTGDPIVGLGATVSSDVPGLYAGWDGRWLLIGEDTIHADFMCTIPVFYDESGAVSSTPGLLSGGQLPRPPLVSGAPCDWFPGPLSGFDSIRRLLPSQVLHPGDGTVVSRSLPGGSRATRSDHVQDMQNMLQAFVRNVKATRIVVPLTAGYDSRLLLATCLTAKVEVLAVTLAHPTMSKADRDLPPVLARAAGFDHVLIPPAGRSHSAGEMYDAQVAGHIHETDRKFMVRNQYRWAREGDVMLRGLSLDITRCVYHRHVAVASEGIDSWRKALRPSERQEAGLQAYWEWRNQDPQRVPSDYRFDLEQGNCCWAATSDVALDLLACKPMEPGNSYAYQDAALSLPSDYRQRSQHHIDLIERMSPDLVSVPFNPPEAKWRNPARVRAAVARRALRLLGGRSPRQGL